MNPTVASSPMTALRLRLRSVTTRSAQSPVASVEGAEQGAQPAGLGVAARLRVDGDDAGIGAGDGRQRNTRLAEHRLRALGIVRPHVVVVRSEPRLRCVGV